MIILNSIFEAQFTLCVFVSPYQHLCRRNHKWEDSTTMRLLLDWDWTELGNTKECVIWS